MMNNKALIAYILVLVWPSIALTDTYTSKSLDLISAEAGETDMQETPDSSLSNSAEDIEEDEPVASRSVDEKSEDALSDSITSQLSEILGEGNSSNSETEEKLEKMVSSALINGANMNELRSAVSAAMDDIKSSPEEATSVQIEQTSKSLNKLVGKKVSRAKLIKNLDLEEKELKVLLKTQSATRRPRASQKSPSRKLPKTVTVLDGESLYKVALRVYGRGDEYLRLYNANKAILADPNRIQAGQVLKIPSR